MNKDTQFVESIASIQSKSMEVRDTPTYEEISLIRMGYSIKPYSGKIDHTTFEATIDQLNKDKETAGSHHQIYIEPDIPVCHKTIIIGEEQPLKSIATQKSHLPGCLQEGIFLSKLNKLNLPCIPKFYGFTKLADGRVATTEQFVENSTNIPIEHLNQMNHMSTPFIMSLMRAFTELGQTVDTITRMGGEINSTEIRGNIRMETKDNRVERLWIVDFERYTDIDTEREPDLSMDTISNRANIAVTIYSLCAEAIRTRPDNPNHITNHPVMDYLSWVIYDYGSNEEWSKPTSNVVLMKNVLNILEQHPFEEFVQPVYPVIAQLEFTRASEEEFSMILD